MKNKGLQLYIYICACILGVFICLENIVFPLLIQYKINQHRKERKLELLSEKTTHYVFKINADNQKYFSFPEKGELLYRGIMYDIITQSESNGVHVIECVCDNQETRMLAGITVKLSQSVSGEFNKTISELIIFWYNENFGNNLVHSHPQSENIYIHVIPVCIEKPNSVPVPPPELLG